MRISASRTPSSLCIRRDIGPPGCNSLSRYTAYVLGIPFDLVFGRTDVGGRDAEVLDALSMASRPLRSIKKKTTTDENRLDGSVPRPSFALEPVSFVFFHCCFSFLFAACDVDLHLITPPPTRHASRRPGDFQDDTAPQAGHDVQRDVGEGYQSDVQKVHGECRFPSAPRLETSLIVISSLSKSLSTMRRSLHCTASNNTT
jgi:hypothetical protein